MKLTLVEKFYFHAGYILVVEIRRSSNYLVQLLPIQKGKKSFDTRNWDSLELEEKMPIGQKWEVEWLDIDGIKVRHPCFVVEKWRNKSFTLPFFELV